MGKKNIGLINCLTPGCNAQAVVKEAENGTLSYSCQHCGFTPYFRAGESCTDAVRSKLVPMPGAAQTGQELSSKAEAEPVIQNQKKAGGFGLSFGAANG